MKKSGEFNYSRSTLFRLLHELGFKYQKRNNKVFIYERPEIIAHRNRYLRELMKIRAQKNPASIIYIAETWLNAHHSVCNVWQDTMVNENPDKAKMDNLSLGLPQPSGKGQRLIITHAGGNFGFVKNGLWTLEQAKERLIILKKWMLNILKMVYEKTCSQHT